MKPNRNKLIALMKEYHADSNFVAHQLGVEPATARLWRCKSGADIPDTKLQLLQEKLNKL